MHMGSAQVLSPDPTGVSNSNTIKGKTDGIEIRQAGAAYASVFAFTGTTIIGETQDGVQITDTNSSMTDIAVTVHDVQAGSRGINLDNQGTGTVSVVATGNITGVGGLGNATGGDAIDINTSSTSGSYDLAMAPDMAVYVATQSGKVIEAGADGIDVWHEGKLGVEIQSNANITAGADGIEVDMTNADAGKLIIDSTGSIDAQASGIKAITDGKGDATVTVGGAVTAAGTGTGEVGMGVIHQGATGNVDITTNATVTFNGTGTGEAAIAAERNGAGATGDVNIAVNGAVTSKTHGVIAINDADSGNSKITQNAAVTADYSGVWINQGADGDATIISNATVVANGNATGNVGIGIDHAGTGNIFINAAALVEFNGTGAMEYAVDATHTGTGDITVLTSVVDSDTHGIAADHSGTGFIQVNALGKITTKGIGIDVLGGNDVTRVGVSAAAIDASMGSDGMHVVNNGRGGTGISAFGAIDAGKDGIFLSTGSNTLSAGIYVFADAAIKAGENGIDATHNGVGLLQIGVFADVTGGTGYAIKTATQAGNLTLLQIDNGATISSMSGQAISNNQGDSTIYIASSTTIQGDISLGDGTDELNINGANVAGVTLFDGGDDTLAGDGWIDTLNFNGVTLTANGGIFQNWEVFNLNNSSTLNANSGTIGAGQMNVSAGSTLNFGNAGAGALTIAGNLKNDGTVTSQDNATGDTLTVNGNYDGNGSLLIDTRLDDGAVDTTDKLVIVGNNDGDIPVNVNNVSGDGGYTGDGPTDGIQVVEVQGANNGNITLANGPLVAGAYIYDTINDNGYLQSKPATSAMAVAMAQMLMPTAMESLWERTSSNWAARHAATGGSTQAAGFAITPTAATPVDLISGLWVRARYRYRKANADMTVAGTPFGGSMKTNRIWAQMGYTHNLMADASGVLAGSLFAQYKYTKLKFSSPGLNDVSSNAKGFGGGASLTWMGANGLYGDLYGEVNRHRLDVTDTVLAASAKTWITTWRASVEGGWRIGVAEGVNLIPQAQLNISGSKVKSFNIGAVNYGGGSFTQATGRLGLGVELFNLAVSDQMDLTTQFTASILHDFKKSYSTSVNGQQVTAELSPTRAELRSSLVAHDYASGLSFFLEKSFQHSLKGPKQHVLHVSGGFKLSF